MTSGFAVVNFHSADDVAGLVASLPQQEASGLVVAVVDNSTDPAELARLNAIATESPLDVRVRDAGRNGGYAAGNNLAADTLLDAGADVLVIINPDCRWREGSVGELERFCAAHPDAIVSIPTLEGGRRRTGVMRYRPVTGYFTDDEPGSPHPLAYASGHAFAMTADTWRALGGLTEDYFLYCEEIDLALRQRLRGRGLATWPGGLVEHEGGGAINAAASGRSATSYFHGTRSRVMLHRRFGRLRRYLPALVVLRAGWAVAMLVTGNRDGARAVFRALRDGLRAPL